MRSRSRTAWASTLLVALFVLAVLALLGGCGGGSAATGVDASDGAGGGDGAGSTGPVAASPSSGGRSTGATAIATFAAGCFWGVEARFAAIPGVVDAVVGYTGGTTAEPTYEQVCSDATGHAEAVRLEYDPDLVSFERLVEAFFAMHDPTTEDRQGPDCRVAVPLGDLLPHAAARGHRPRRGGTPRRVRHLPGPDRHRDRAGRGVLARRGLPSGLLRAAGRRGVPHVRTRQGRPERPRRRRERPGRRGSPGARSAPPSSCSSSPR